MLHMNKNTGTVSRLGKTGKRSGSRAGIVRAYLRRDKARGRRVSASQLNQQVREGLFYSEFEDLQASLRLPAAQLAEQVGLSRATLQRRKKNAGYLTAIQSDRVVRLARLLGKAIEVFEDKETAREWMLSPQRGLGGEIPIDFAFTDVGLREVESLLGRIEHGVFS